MIVAMPQWEDLARSAMVTCNADFDEIRPFRAQNLPHAMRGINRRAAPSADEVLCGQLEFYLSG